MKRARTARPGAAGDVVPGAVLASYAAPAREVLIFFQRAGTRTVATREPVAAR